MKPLLYLVHRIPYPPNKGDKIRSFHWLKGLSKQFDIYLGTFVDDENDWQYVNEVSEYCADARVQKLTPKTAKLKSLRGLITGDALTVPYYASKQMQQWVDTVVAAKNISEVLIFSSSMAQFVGATQFENCRRIVDFVDMDSDKWMQYAENMRGPMAWVYRREAKTLLDYEQKIARKFDKSLFVSNKEAALFSEKLGNTSAEVDYVNNGVDTDYFFQDKNLLNPYAHGDNVIVFTGAMDYWANVDAVKWFAYEIFPALCRKVARLKFVIVGSKPAQEVLNLQSIDGIVVTGFVDDVRPYIAFANVVVAPMRIARGIQNKVLEAMSMGKIVVVSQQGLEGIQAEPGVELLLAEDKPDWIEKVTQALLERKPEMEKNARVCVMEHYSWQSNIDKLLACFEESN